MMVATLGVEQEPEGLFCGGSVGTNNNSSNDLVINHLRNIHALKVTIPVSYDTPDEAETSASSSSPDNPTKSHSTCSDGSLLSMGSSEMDEDSLGHNSGHSSKVSLHEKKTFHDNDLEFDLGVSATPLSHSAARHKMAVRPKRTHGAPRRRRIQQLAGGSPLPSTPELNEEASGRSASPDVRSSGQDFAGTDELSTTTATTTTVTTTASDTENWSPADGMKSAIPVANLLPAETQLKSASLPPGLALTPEMLGGETPIIPKVKRCNSNIAQKQGTTVQHFQRSISDNEYSLSSRTTNVLSYQHTRMLTTENDVSKGLKVSSELQKRVCGIVGEEDEDNRDYEVHEDVMSKERDKDDKRKDDSSFFSRFIRRSGKKKKEIPHEIDTGSNSSGYSSKPISEPPPVVPKRIDLKGRYANETVNDYAVNLPPTQMKLVSGKLGGARSTPASRQRVKPINIPASPEGQRKMETNREMEEMTIGLPLPSPSLDVEPEIGSKRSQESVPVNRMQVSYSTSPPKPTWPDSSSGFYSNKPPDSPFYSMNKNNSEIVPPWRDSLEPRLIDNSWTQDHEHITEVQHFRSKLKIAGLSSYQQRVIANELRNDEREYTSLIDTMNNEDSEENRKHAVKKSKSFRREPEIPILSHNLPAFTGETETDAIRSPQEYILKDEALWKYGDEQGKTVNSHRRDNINENGLYSSSPNENFHMINGSKEEVDKINTSSDFHGRHFTKNTMITTRSIVKEVSSIAENSPVSRIRNSRHPDRMMKKSASLDSIGSFSDSKTSPSPEPRLSSKKSSSSESISSYTQQVLIPVSPDGFSITQTTKIDEDNRTLPIISSTESSIVPESNNDIPPLDVPKSNSFPVSPKPSLPESTKPHVDTSSKPFEPSSRLSTGILNQSIERPKPTNDKEQSQVSTPNRVQGSRVRSVGPPAPTEHIPEFLKVQLNRVDSKPATNVVLSTSMVFDNTERSYSPLKLSDDRQTRLKRKESLGKVIDKPNSGVSETTLNVLVADGSATQTTQISGVIERKSSREDLVTGGNVVYDSHVAVESVTQKVTETSTAQEVEHRVCAVTESSGKLSDSDSSVSSQKQRSKSLPSTNPVNNRKYSVVSISSTMTTSSSVTPSRPALKKQASSLDSLENNKSIMKKQQSQDSDDGTMTDKSNLQEVSNKSEISRKKPLTKERGSWKEEEGITEKLSETGSVEVVLRSKKIISTKDLPKRDEETSEKRTSAGVESINSHEGKKFGVWKDEEGHSEKRTSGGESNAQDNNPCTPEVVLRKKSMSRADIGRSGGGRDEEPELLKVFARRSLKLKDSESDALGQQVVAKTRPESTSEQQGTKSRDSDKENEGGDSPREERKKQLIKEPLAESKIHIESSDTTPVLKSSSAGISLSNTPRNGSIVTSANKYQRSISSGVSINNELAAQNNESSLIYRKENPGSSPDKRQRNRTVPESPKTDSNIEKTPHRAWANIYKEKDIEINNSDTKKSNSDKINVQGENKTVSGNNEEISVPKFKRIQQRKEEWEQRAQQALKKTLP